MSVLVTIGRDETNGPNINVNFVVSTSAGLMKYEVANDRIVSRY